MAITDKILDAASPSKEAVISSSESSDSEDDSPLSSLVSVRAGHESSEFMPLDGFSDLEEESLTTVTAELLSEAISTVDNTTNVSYYLFNTDSKAKWSVISGFLLSNAYSAKETLASLQKKSINLTIFFR